MSRGHWPRARCPFPASKLYDQSPSRHVTKQCLSIGSSALTPAFSMFTFVSWAGEKRVNMISRTFPRQLLWFFRKVQNPHRILGAICYEQSWSVIYPKTGVLRALVLYLYCT